MTMKISLLKLRQIVNIILSESTSAADSTKLAIQALNGDQTAFLVLQDLDEENGFEWLRTGKSYEKIKRLGTLADPAGSVETAQQFSFHHDGKKLRSIMMKLLQQNGLKGMLQNISKRNRMVLLEESLEDKFIF